ncbi:MAG: elongation factor P [Candidatus Adiutrix intracellularis]|jgi:elongation factor P|nr:MAG: elongation factor P [Candidatus Adiutrix intracellularis]MDR2826767.1 elongation factor P [Candidatus Adiutrix intracellularis]
MYLTSDFRRGLKVQFKGEPYIIVEFQHVKPGKGGAFVRTKIKNLLTGRVLEETFRSGEKLNRPDLEEKNVQYLYSDAKDGYVFMDETTYEQLHLTESQVGDSRFYLLENMNLTINLYKGQPIGLDFPTTVNLEVTKSDPGLKGDTATGAIKPATLSTGLIVQVPLFINEGDILKIDTRSGEYIERVK